MRGKLILFCRIDLFSGVTLSEPGLACHTEFFQLPIAIVIGIMMLAYFAPPLVSSFLYFVIWLRMRERRRKLFRRAPSGK